MFPLPYVPLQDYRGSRGWNADRSGVAKRPGTFRANSKTRSVRSDCPAGDSGAGHRRWVRPRDPFVLPACGSANHICFLDPTQGVRRPVLRDRQEGRGEDGRVRPRRAGDRLHRRPAGVAGLRHAPSRAVRWDRLRRTEHSENPGERTVLPPEGRHGPDALPRPLEEHGRLAAVYEVRRTAGRRRPALLEERFGRLPSSGGMCPARSAASTACSPPRRSRPGAWQSHVSVRPSFIDRFARMQLAVEMCPCSMSATGLPRSSRCLEEVAHVPADRRRDVPLQVLLGLVLGVLVLLEQRRRR